MFPRFRLRTQLVKGFAPTVPAAAVVLALRWGTDAAGVRPPGLALAEVVLFVAVTLATTASLERRLLREMLGYLRSGGIGTPRPVPVSTASGPAL
jgi:hypothetical protein